jgi:hypothetical protein
MKKILFISFIAATSIFISSNITKAAPSTICGQATVRAGLLVDPTKYAGNGCGKQLSLMKCQTYDYTYDLYNRIIWGRPLTELEQMVNIGCKDEWIKIILKPESFLFNTRIASCVKTNNGWNQSEYKLLQTMLSQMGYYSGPIDGLFGNQTVRAVSKLNFDIGNFNFYNFLGLLSC